MSSHEEEYTLEMLPIEDSIFCMYDTAILNAKMMRFVYTVLIL
jgi:hypothetical protein